MPFNPNARGPLEDRSALARGATAGILAYESMNGAFIVALQRTLLLGADVLSDTRSHGVGCSGRRLMDEAVMTFVEGGVPFFKSAGNFDNSNRFPARDALACNVGPPGGSIGAFTVAGTLGASTGANNVTRFDNGSHGDPTARRTLVDMAAEASIDFRYTMDTAPGLPSYVTSSGTSISTPIVASAAMVYRGHYNAFPSSYINDPLVMYTRLSLFGNQVGQTSTTDRSALTSLSSGFGAAWGAGKLHLKPLEIPTSPGVFERSSRAGEVCVREDETVEIPLPEVGAVGGPVVAVARFFNRRHATRGDLDAIDMRLVRVFPNGARVVMSSDVSRQEMMRTSMANAFIGSDFRLQLRGVDIVGRDEFCGGRSRRVVFAYRWQP